MNELAGLITTNALARIKRVSRRTIYNWREKGMPVVKIPGGVLQPVRYRLEDVNRWMRARGDGSEVVLHDRGRYVSEVALHGRGKRVARDARKSAKKRPDFPGKQQKTGITR
jgi:phage terminase Nu1 subunit (DNA packaging protein)